MARHTARHVVTGTVTERHTASGAGVNRVTRGLHTARRALAGRAGVLLAARRAKSHVRRDAG